MIFQLAHTTCLFCILSNILHVIYASLSFQAVAEMAAIGFGLPKDAFTSLMKQVTNDCQVKLTFMSL